MSHNKYIDIVKDQRKTNEKPQLDLSFLAETIFVPRRKSASSYSVLEIVTA